MLKFIGFALIFLAFLMILPTTNSNTQSDLPKMYGIATIVLKDSTGNILFENVIHNEVVNTGTDFMLDQAFRDTSTDTSDGNQVDTMCVTNAVAVDTSNTATATSFNSDNLLTSTNCIGNIVFSRTDTTANSGTQIFSETTHFPADTVVTGIGICGNDTFGAGPFLDCKIAANQAPLLAVFDTTNVTVGAGESVDITYELTLD